MKKILFMLMLLLIMPVMANATTLTKRINIPISGIGDLPVEKNNHKMTITSKSNIINITVETNDENATVEGAGKIELQEGENNIAIKVSNEETTEEYNLNINYSKTVNNNTNTDDKNNPNTGATINIIAMCALSSLAISTIIYSRKKDRLF